MPDKTAASHDEDRDYDLRVREIALREAIEWAARADYKVNLMDCFATFERLLRDGGR